MRILLTGGTGYIGSAVLDALADAGHEVVAVVRSRGPPSGSRTRRDGAQGDVTDVAWFAQALAGVDAAIHTAAPDEGAPGVQRGGRRCRDPAFGGTGAGSC